MGRAVKPFITFLILLASQYSYGQSNPGLCLQGSVKSKSSFWIDYDEHRTSTLSNLLEKLVFSGKNNSLIGLTLLLSGDHKFIDSVYISPSLKSGELHKTTFNLKLNNSKIFHPFQIITLSVISN